LAQLLHASTGARDALLRSLREKLKADHKSGLNSSAHVGSVYPDPWRQERLSMTERSNSLPMTRQEVKVEMKEFISEMEIQEVQVKDLPLQNIDFSHAYP
jgi:hypothetical protein